MRSSLITFMVLSIFAHIAISQSPPDALVGNSLASSNSLLAGQSLKAENGPYYAYLQHDCNFVLYTADDLSSYSFNTQTNDQGTPPCRLLLQEDGNLVLYDANEDPLWFSNTYDQYQGPYNLLMQDDGELVLQDSSNQRIWSAGNTGDANNEGGENTDEGNGENQIGTGDAPSDDNTGDNTGDNTDNKVVVATTPDGEQGDQQVNTDSQQPATLQKTFTSPVAWDYCFTLYSEFDQQGDSLPLCIDTNYGWDDIPVPDEWKARARSLSSNRFSSGFVYAKNNVATDDPNVGSPSYNIEEDSRFNLPDTATSSLVRVEIYNITGTDNPHFFTEANFAGSMAIAQLGALNFPANIANQIRSFMVGGDRYRFTLYSEENQQGTSFGPYTRGWYADAGSVGLQVKSVLVENNPNYAPDG